MARTVERLTDLGVKRKKRAGLYPDGGGLYLQVTGDGDESIAKSWLYRFALRGKRRDMGLGSLAAMSLADARKAAAEARKMHQAGIDPIEHRGAQRAAMALEAANAVTFEDHAKTSLKCRRAHGEAQKARCSGKIA
jgi:Arm DNA-binding domain